MSYPSMQPAAGAQEVTLSLHDGNQRTVHVTEQERPYPKGRLIVSRTDTNGIITHANEAFIEISGYTRDELIGQPHNVLRHPDMPHALFQSLWPPEKNGTATSRTCARTVPITGSTPRPCPMSARAR